MKRIILLRFHKDIDLVQNRIDLLLKFNNNIDIHGLYGGYISNFAQFSTKLRGLTSITLLDKSKKEFLWKRGDLSILEWYLKTGKKLNFESVYTIEYDLIYLDKLENIFHIPENAIALTGLININDISENWDWITKSPYKKESFRFLDFMKNKYGLTSMFACLAPGSVLTKEFLEKYAASKVPQIAHDELRLPQLANAFGIKIVDTGFYNNWNNKNPEIERGFNCNKIEIPISNVLLEYSKGKRKVFHPVFKLFPINDL